MSTKLGCSLCCASSSDYMTLQNEEGESTEVYEITVKFFDPMLITEEENNKSSQANKVLCLNCWVPIKKFHEFQQNVIETRTLLEKAVATQLPILVKVEYDVDDTTTYEDEADVDESDDEFKFEKVKVRNELEGSRDSLATNNKVDENPLIHLRKTNRIVKSCEKNIDKGEKNQKEKPKLRRGRKPKNVSNKKHEDSTDLEEDVTLMKKLKLSDKFKEKGKSTFNLEKARESDVFIAEWKPVLECDLCEETSSSFDKLRCHFKEKHKTRFYIKCCERKFYRRYVLVNHIQLHLNPETYKCEICGKVSANKNNLKLHKKLMHEEIEQLECEICHKLFNLKTSLDRHLLTHVTGDKDFVCQECGKGYVLEVQLKSHIKTVHNIDRVCDQCGKTIHGIQALKKHLMEHAGIEKPKFSCDECGAELNSRNGLRRHKAAYHHDGSTIYVCSICGKVATSESALLNHKKYVHEEERKHKCTYCDKAFKRPKNLLEHIATHTGQDLYQCPHCSQTFKVSANMHHHRKKVHPIEWEEGRKNRLQVPKVDINHVKNQVVL